MKNLHYHPLEHGITFSFSSTLLYPVICPCYLKIHMNNEISNKEYTGTFCKKPVLSVERFAMYDVSLNVKLIYIL